MRLKSTVIVIIGMLFAETSSAQNAVLVFGNGVSVSQPKAWKEEQLLEAVYAAHRGVSIEELERHFEPQLAYNTTDCSSPSNPEGSAFCLGDWYEALTQAAQDSGLGFGSTDVWQFLLSGTATQGLLDVFLSSALLTAKTFDQEVITEHDLTEHLALYQDRIKSGKRVLLVAHSQGNFFANNSYALLPQKYRQAFGLVAVATPASFVAGDGLHRTSFTDFIHTIPGALPPNTLSGPLCVPGWGCHAFDQYINGTVSGPQIMTDMDTVLASLVPVPRVQPGFTRITDMQTPRSYHCAVRLASGKVLLVGGSDGGGFSLTSAELYDPATHTFTRTTRNMNTPRGRGISCALLDDGRVLVAGGATARFYYTASAEIYDPVEDGFIPAGDMTTPRAEGWQMFSVPGGAILFGGTYEGGVGTATAAVDRFNSASASFTRVGTLASARRDYTAAQMLTGGTTLLVGGVSRFDQGVSPVAELWDPVTNQSVAIGQPVDSPFARNWGSAVLPDRNLLVVSGAGFPAEIYRTESRSFATVAGSPNFYAGDFASAVSLANGKALLLGYGRMSGQGGRIAEIFDPATTTFSAIGSFAVSGLCGGYVSTLLQDGTVLITGGGAPPTCDTAPLAEILNPVGL